MAFDATPDTAVFDETGEGMPASLDRLLACPQQQVPAVLLVAGAVARDGGWAAAAAVHFARNWAARNRRVILGDLCFDSPELHRLVGVQNHEGMVDLLLFGAPMRQVVCHVPEHGFHFVPAGSAAADGGDLLRHQRWTRLLSGFANARATFFVFVPADADGIDALARLVGRAVVLAEEEEAELVAGVLSKECSIEAVLVPARRGSGEDATGGLEFAEPPVLPDVGEGDLGAGGSLPAPQAPARSPLAQSSGVDSELQPVSEAEAEPAFAEAADDEPDVLPELGPEQADPFPLTHDLPLLEEQTPEPLSPAGNVDGADAGSELPSDATPFAELEEGPPSAAEPPIGQEPDPIATGSDAIGEQPAASAPADDEGVAARDVAGPSGSPRFLDEPLIAKPSSNVGRRRLSPLYLIVLLVVLGFAAWWHGRDSLGRGRAETPAPSGPAPPVVPGETLPPPTPRQVLDSVVPFSVVVESHRSLEAAESRANELSAFHPEMLFFVAPVGVGGQPWYRVLTGPARDSASAAALQAGLVAAGRASDDSWSIRHTPLAFLLGEFDGSEAAANEVALRREQGIPCYILEIRYSGGLSRHRVYSGAYADQAEAGLLASRLRGAGITAPLEERVGQPTP